MSIEWRLSLASTEITFGGDKMWVVERGDHPIGRVVATADLANPKYTPAGYLTCTTKTGGSTAAELVAYLMDVGGDVYKMVLNSWTYRPTTVLLDPPVRAEELMGDEASRKMASLILERSLGEQTEGQIIKSGP